MSRWKLSEHNFENFYVRCPFYIKRKNFAQNFTTSCDFRPPQVHNYAMITDRRKFTTKWSLYAMSCFHFYRYKLESIQNHSPWLYTPYKKPTQIFGNVRCPILGKPSTRLCDLNWKLKISNTTNNADITQSHTRNTMHRRMQEVNSLCTDNGPLWAEYCIVDISHNTAV